MSPCAGRSLLRVGPGVSFQTQAKITPQNGKVRTSTAEGQKALGAGTTQHRDPGAPIPELHLLTGEDEHCFHVLPGKYAIYHSPKLSPDLLC